MWHDFTLREVERHLQGDQDGELERYQLPPADPETLLQLLQTQTESRAWFTMTGQSHGFI